VDAGKGMMAKKGCGAFKCPFLSGTLLECGLHCHGGFLYFGSRLEEISFSLVKGGKMKPHRPHNLAVDWSWNHQKVLTPALVSE
jgi:hypothetical protein